MFSAKDELVNFLGLEVYTSLLCTQLCSCSMKVAIDNLKQKRAAALCNIYLQKQAMGQICSMGCSSTTLVICHEYRLEDLRKNMKMKKKWYWQ